MDKKIGPDGLDMAALSAFLELNPPALQYSSLVGIPSPAKNFAKVTRAAGQVWSSTGPFFVPISWDTLVTDGIDSFAAGTPTRLTFQKAGFYLVMFSLTASGQTGSGSITTNLARYDSGGTLKENAQGSQGGMNQSSSAFDAFLADTGDYVEGQFNQGATGSAGSATGRLIVVRFATT